MTCAAVLYLNPGSDALAHGVALDESGAALDLTGFTPELFDVTGDLVGAITATFTDPATGAFDLAITWGGAWSASWPRDIGSARIRFVSGAVQQGPLGFSVQAPSNGARLDAPRGSDATWELTWPDDSDGADLTGQTVDAINVSAALAGRVSVTVLDAATRRVSVKVEGETPLPVGDAGSFQLRRATAGANRRTLPPMLVTVK